jgi:hypothetical protein
MPSANETKRPTTTAPAAAHQVSAHPVLEADMAVGRIASRLTTEFFLRTAHLISGLSGGDLMEGLILRAIIVGNISHVDHDPKNPGRFASVDDIPPDELRRPMSVLAIANSLGLPYETTRRYANRLVKEGQCVRVKGGLIARAADHQTPQDTQGILANMANLRRLHAALKLAGVTFE